MMTAQDYTRYTGSAFTTKFRTPGDAIRFSLNKHNYGKTKIIMLEDETFGVMQSAYIDGLKSKWSLLDIRAELGRRAAVHFEPEPIRFDVKSPGRGALAFCYFSPSG